MTLSTLEIHTEEVRVGGLIIKVFVSLDNITKNYTVLCKAYDGNGTMMWNTVIMDAEGKPQVFHSLPSAVTKIRNLFAGYQKALKV